MIKFAIFNTEGKRLSEWCQDFYTVEHKLFDMIDSDNGSELFIKAAPSAFIKSVKTYAVQDSKGATMIDGLKSHSAAVTWAISAYDKDVWTIRCDETVDFVGWGSPLPRSYEYAVFGWGLRKSEWGTYYEAVSKLPKKSRHIIARREKSHLVDACYKSVWVVFGRHGDIISPKDAFKNAEEARLWRKKSVPKGDRFWHIVGVDYVLETKESVWYALYNTSGIRVSPWCHDIYEDVNVIRVQKGGFIVAVYNDPFGYPDQEPFSITITKNNDVFVFPKGAGERWKYCITLNRSDGKPYLDNCDVKLMMEHCAVGSILCPMISFKKGEGDGSK